MSVKVLFEIGHESVLKQKPSIEGFTHDWELFVRGCDNSDISHFVDKVVFNLHESFPKPKRVVKEPPYSVKESGYAGFVLSVDIYVKNRDEPKKITFSYDLDLQQKGPAIQRRQTEKFIFSNPSEEFRRKLLKGGGVLISNTTSNLDEKNRDGEDRAKNKMSAMGMNDAPKKHKIRPEDPFTNLFGTPITKTSTKVSPDPKSKASPNRGSKPQQQSQAASAQSIGGKSNAEKTTGSKDKSEKESKSKHSKHSSPHRDRSGEGKDSRKGEGDKYERREEKKKDRNHSKDRDKSKEKSVKRPTTPKRSPKRLSPSRGNTSSKPEEKPQPVPAGGTEKSGGSSKKLKKEKKEKTHDKERDRKEHKKDTISVSSVSKVNVTDKGDTGKSVKESSQGPKESVRDKIKDTVKTPPEIPPSAIDVTGQKSLDKRADKQHEKDSERKHKHKKKDKSGSSKEKKKDKSGSGSRAKDDVNSTPTKISSKSSSGQDSGKSHPAAVVESGKKVVTPLDKLYDELGDGISSDSDIESSMSEKNDVPAVAVGCENSNSSLQDVSAAKPEEMKSTKKSRSDKKSSAEKKKKRNREEMAESVAGGKDSPAISKMDPPTKIPRRGGGDDLYKNGDAGTPGFTSGSTPSDEGSSYRSGGTPSGSVVSSGVNPPLSMDYMSELKDLQHKIMTLQDNNELQQVVEMIAATGQYEITSKTFDFDLCALDKGTVQRLQEFFATS